MGAYLPKPVKDKFSEAGENSVLQYGACSMQGWRTHQEDAHNCIADYDDGASFFAVYDGHGGHEVAEYAAKKFPEMLKQMETYSKGRYAQALQEAFLKFDELLIDPQIVEELKALVGMPTEENDEDDEDKARLIEEANLPIEDVLSRYGIQLRVVDRENDNDEGEGEERKEETDGVRRRTLQIKRTSKRKIVTVRKVDKTPNNENGCLKNNENNDNNDGEKPVGEKRKSTEMALDEKCSGDDKVVMEIPVEKVNGVPKGAIDKEEDSTNVQMSPKIDSETKSPNENPKTVQNGCEDEPPLKKGKTVAENGNDTAKHESKENCNDAVVTIFDKIVETDSNGQVIFQSKTITVKSDADGKVTLEETDDLESAVEGDLPEDDDDEYEDDDESDEKEGESSESDEESEDGACEEMVEEEFGDFDEFPVPTEEKPGVSSGTTACVVLLKDGQAFVANAGDSRCVLCRGGKAVDLSADHKPEDEVERRRITAAGGKVTDEGRVNGGLNLSRALGDHFYKTNADLPLQDQMISCQPDIVVETLQPEDSFIVIACDGIWNSMSSQAVVDFVSTRLDKGFEPKKICDDICDNCLADDTLGDGTGCDNMTVVIVELKKTSEKKESCQKNNETARNDICA